MGIGLAFRCFVRILRDGEFASKAQALLEAPEKDVEVERRRTLAAELQLLGLLQRDGRLLDFLSEELDGYSDDQIGAAVRDIHRDCKRVLSKYVDLDPVIDREEDSSVEIPAGFDPARIRLSGNVAGNPPFRGVLAHRGWVAKEVRLPDRTDVSDPNVLAPAEVEIP